MKKIASTNSNAKLSEQDIHEIIQLHKTGMYFRKIASNCGYESLGKKYGITRNQVYRVVKGYSYKHVKREE